MSAGLDAGDKDSSDSDGDADEVSINPPVRREDKKTERQRKKDKEIKEQVRPTDN